MEPMRIEESRVGPEAIAPAGAGALIVVRGGAKACAARLP